MPAGDDNGTNQKQGCGPGKRVWGHKHNLTLWTIMFIIYGRCSLGVIGGRRARFAPALPSNRLSGWEANV